MSRSVGITPQTVVATLLRSSKRCVSDLSSRSGQRKCWPQGEIISSLTAEAAEHPGLGRNVQVIQGGADAFIGTPGLGVAQPGQLALIKGSSHLMLGVSHRPMSAVGLWGSCANAVYPGRHIIEGGQTSTGSIVNWLRRLAGGDFDLAPLNEQAAKLEPGCDGLLVLDHFQGNRTPYVDALSRSAIVGLTLGHGLPHLFRAVIEGICFGTKAILDRMADTGFIPKELTVGGGATSSDLWLQIHADTSGLPVSVPEVSAAPSLGAAILAAVGSGHFASIDDGIAHMVRPGRRINPRSEYVARYKGIYQSYAALYPALKPFNQLQASAHAVPSTGIQQ